MAAEVILGVAASILGLAAVLTAIVQTIMAVLQCWQINSRCSRSVTGIFKLGEGIFFSLTTLAWNPRYRMPVITMPYLRVRAVPAMEPSGIPVDAYYGRNFDRAHNCYLDIKQPRITGTAKRHEHGRTKKRSLARTVAAVAWTPFGTLISVLMYACCCPCCTFCVCDVTHSLVSGKSVKELEEEPTGGCGPSCASWDMLTALVYPLTCIWEEEEEKHDSQESIALAPSETPGLEFAAWVQLLVNIQATWWGYADIRWEWRLASHIPQDVYGATAETTMADIQLLAVMSGMQLTNEPGVLCRSRCGDLISLSDHPHLGRMAYYRSGRDNAGSDIFHEPPKGQCTWLHACIAAQRMCLQGHPTQSISRADGAFILLSRKRSIFDAQVNFATGNTCWIFSSPAFVAARQRLETNGRNTGADWEPAEALVSLGPLGQGVGRCSCTSCSSQWYKSQLHSEKAIKSSTDDVEWNTVRVTDSDPTDDDKDRRFASALSLSNCVIQNRTVLVVGQHLGLEDSLARPDFAPVATGWETRRVCNSSCLVIQQCRCRIARLREQEHEHSIEAKIAVAAVNTRWLSRAPAQLIRASASSLVRSMCEEDHTLLAPMEEITSHPQDVIGIVGMVMAYTECLLPDVRHHIGALDIWSDCHVPPLTDFTPVILGS